MGYAVKHSTSNVNDTFRKGNVVLGVSSDGYEDTDTSGLYAGIPPVAGKHNIVVTSATEDPDFYVVDDDGLILLSRNLGQEVDNVNDALLFLSQQDNLAFVDQLPNDTITDGLVLSLDASNLSSYPTTGSTWYDLSGNNNSGSLVNGASYSNEAITFDGVDDYVSYPTITFDNTTFTTEALISLPGPLDTSNRRIIFGSARYWEFSNFSTILMRFNAEGTSTFVNIGGHSVELNKPFLHHLVKKPGNIYESYINGELMSTKTPPFTSYPDIEITSNTSIEHYYSWLGSAGGRQFNGNFYSAKIYNKNLSQSEILQNYYGGNIVTDGLVFAVDAGNLVSYESGSTTAYSMTGSYSASLDNGVGFRQDNGGVFYFDGSDDIITGPNINPPSITVEVWKKWTTVSDDWLITNQVAPTDSSKGYYIRIDSPSYDMRFYAGTGPSARVVATTIELNKWYHVVGNIDANSTNLYVNGELVSTTSGGTIDYTGVQGLTIGADNTNQRDTPGPVGPIRIYDRALTADEVLQNYNAQKARFI
jgi:hypothetical protein